VIAKTDIAAQLALDSGLRSPRVYLRELAWLASGRVPAVEW
jgi:hypothetical protein